MPRLLLAVAAAAGVHLSATAAEVLPGLDVHGYGNVDLVRESVSPQAQTTSEHDLSLLGTYQVTDHGRLWAQVVHLRSTGHAHVDLLFFDGELDPQTTLRVGEARLPVGIYNETRDVQSLRASSSLPLLYAGDPVAMDKAMRGVTLDHRFAGSALGSFQVEAFAAYRVVPDGEEAEHAAMAGGRLTWATGLDGLTLKLSAYSGHLKNVDAPDRKPREQAIVTSASYETGPWILDAEAASSRADGHAYDAGYVQLDRRLAPGWRAFARLEAVRDHDFHGDETAPRRLRRVAAGPAWDAAHWGVRLEAGRDGGRLADLPPGIAPRTVRPHWNDYRISTNYIF